MQQIHKLSKGVTHCQRPLSATNSLCLGGERGSAYVLYKLPVAYE